MRTGCLFYLSLFLSSFATAVVLGANPGQKVLLSPPENSILGEHGGRSISAKLFAELEELSRVVDIAYCVGATGLGIQKPFSCLGRCGDFPNFELVKTWNTGPLLSDSCGYIALSHPPSPARIIVAFRGTYSLANTIADLSTIPQEYEPYPGGDDTPGHLPKCENCTVHMGFFRSWENTKDSILPALEEVKTLYPDYAVTLVGHSLGGAVAALASLDFKARGWDPRVTTFGEPRAGNEGLTHYIDALFNLSSTNKDHWKYHRVTHVGDPVPSLPLEEWGYRMHGGEVFIAKPELPPSVADIRVCEGDEDPTCIANNPEKAGDDGEGIKGRWGLQDRLKLWELFFAHRDYFWRLGLCVPGGDPWNWWGRGDM